MESTTTQFLKTAFGIVTILLDDTERSMPEIIEYVKISMYHAKPLGIVKEIQQKLTFTCNIKWDSSSENVNVDLLNNQVP